MYIRTWAELRCPNCENSNFVNQGDLEDITVDDPEGCCCWKCATCFSFDGDLMIGRKKVDIGVNFERID